MITVNINTRVTWVPVTLATPAQDGIYIVTKQQSNSIYTVDFVEYKDGRWQSGYPIIAWGLMPLPYQVEGDKNKHGNGLDSSY